MQSGYKYQLKLDIVKCKFLITKMPMGSSKSIFDDFQSLVFVLPNFHQKIGF